MPKIKKEGFHESEYNHRAEYYTVLNLAAIWNGTHSGSAGIFYSNGDISADVFDIRELFDHVTTNGIDWINLHNGEILEEVKEPCLAVLYEIARLKHFKTSS